MSKSDPVFRRGSSPALFTLASGTSGLLALAWSAGAITAQLFGAAPISTLGRLATATKANTALCLGLLGLALLLAAFGKGAAVGFVMIRRLLALVVLAIGALTLLEYLLTADLSIDALVLGLFREPARNLVGGRMAATTSLSFTALGLALLILPVGGRLRALVEGLVLASLLLPLLTLLGLVYGLAPFLGTGIWMMPSTALVLAILAAGVLLLDAEHGALGLLRSRGTEGRIARRLLPVVVVVPLLVGAALVAGRRRALLDPSNGIIFVVLTEILVLAALVAFSAFSIARADRGLRVAEAATGESELRFRMLADYTYDWEYWTAPDGTMIYSSPSCERITGYPSSSFVADKALLQRIVHPDDLALVADHARKEVEGHASIDFRIIRPDGEIRWISHVCRSVPGEGGASLGRRATNRDITERKAFEDSYLALNERFSLALRAANVGIWDWDIARDRLVWDDRMYELYGLSRGDFAGAVEAWEARLHPEDKQKASDIMRRALSGEAEYDTEFRIVLGDGGIRYLRAFARITRDASGAALRMTGVNYDISPARVVENELRRKSELLELTGHMAKVGGWDFDAVTGQGSWSEEVARIHDLEPGTGTSVQYGLDFYSPASRPRIEAAVRSAVDDAEPFDLVLEILSARGVKKWVHTIGMPVVEEGKVTRVQGIFQDVTELTTIEADLRSKERTLRLFVENSPAAIAMLDRDMRYLIASRRWLESYGLEDKDLVGRSHYEVFPEISEEWKEVHRRCLSGAIEKKEEDRFPRADGSVDWVRWEIRPWYTTETDIGGIILFSEVITERKNAEHAIRASEERYRNLFENMTEGFAYCRMVFEGDRPVDWIYLATNPAFERLTGLVDIVGKRVSEAIPGILTSDPDLVRTYGRVSSGGGPEQFETEIRAMDMWFSVSVYSPAPGFFVSVFDVITERKRAEAEVRRLNTELEDRVRQRTAELVAANAELEAFSYSVSHDLRAPLRGIDGYVGILLEEESGRLSEAGRGMLEEVRSGTRHMALLIDDLLEFARLGRAEARKKLVDMGAIVDSVLAELRPGLAGRKVEIVRHPLEAARGDSILLRQVWMNLLANAIKFSSRGEAPRIEITSERSGTATRYSVKDNGAGFDMRYVAKLFNVFQRLHGAGDFEGTGIGLAIVKRIVERHGGSVAAEGEVGKGATLSFLLPFGEDEDE